MSPDDLPARIRSKIQVDPDSGCWDWTAHLNREGYGHAAWNAKSVRAHRLTYHLLADPSFPVQCLNDGLQIDHLCWNKGCVNPDHLEAVSREENTRRYLNRYGWNGPIPVQVLREHGPMTARQVAEHLGCAPQGIISRLAIHERQGLVEVVGSVPCRRSRGARLFAATDGAAA